MKFLIKKKSPLLPPKSGRGYNRLRRFVRAYSVIIYHAGTYPKTGESVGDVSELLEVYGIPVRREEGQIGRTRKKKWPYSQNVKNRFAKRKWQQQIGKITNQIVYGHGVRDYYRGYQRFARGVVKELRKEIMRLREPELALATIQKKTYEKCKDPTKPLIETGRLLKSIRYQVIRNRGRSAEEIRGDWEYEQAGV